MLQAVFFDLDGTLLYTLQDIANAMNGALRELGQEAFPLESYKRMIGDGARMLCLRAARGDEALAGRIQPLYQARYTAHSLDTTRPYEGIQEALAALAAQGARLFVLSNKPDVNTKQTIAHFFPDGVFTEALGQLPEFPVKPDPAATLYLLKKHALDAGRCAFVGDSRNDMLCAVNAELYPAGALWGYRDRAELTQSGAKRLLASPEELTELLSL